MLELTIFRFFALAPAPTKNPERVSSALATLLKVRPFFGLKVELVVFKNMADSVDYGLTTGTGMQILQECYLKFMSRSEQSRIQWSLK